MNATTAHEDTMTITVDRAGVCVNDKRIGWDELRRAAHQDDPIWMYYHGDNMVTAEPDKGTVGLAAQYRKILDEAESIAVKHSPVVVAWGRDNNNVTWSVTCATEWGRIQLGVPGADCGGSLPRADLARAEAAEVVERYRRLRRTVVAP